MKNLTMKVTCFVVILCMVMGSFCAFAAEPENSEHRTLTDEEVYAKLAEAFPEDFLSALSDDVQPVEWDPENQEVVSYESRALSEAEEAVRIEYSNGAKAYLYNVSFLDNSTSVSGLYARYNKDVYMSVSLLVGILHIKSLDYIIYADAFDKINSAGSPSMSESSSSYASGIITRQYENAVQPATARYAGTFDNSVTNIATTVYLEIYVGQNNVTYTAY